MKNLRMKYVVSIYIAVISAICILILFFMADSSLTKILKQSATDSMYDSLSSKSTEIVEAVDKAGELLTAFSSSPIIDDVASCTKDTDVIKTAQDYTSEFFSNLDNWEGLYIGDWETNIITHSNLDSVGIKTRDGDKLTSLQKQLVEADGVINGGVMKSPSSGQLVMSMYVPIKNGDKVTAFVGGACTTKMLNDVILNSKIKSMPNANSYIINLSNNTCIYNPDESLIGSEIEDEMLLTVIDKINNDKSEDISVFNFNDKSGNKLSVSYKYIEKYNWAVVVSDLDSEIFSRVTESTKTLRVLCLIIWLILVLLALFSVSICTKPLTLVQNSILELQDLNLKKQESMFSYIGRKNEVGQIFTALNNLYDVLIGIVDTLNNCSNSLSSTSTDLSEVSETTLISMGEVASAIEEITMGLQNQNDSVTNIVQSIQTVNKSVEDIGVSANEISSYTDKLNTESTEMKSSMSEMSESNNKLNESISTTSERINSINKVIEKVQGIVDVIGDISEQTKLLSLNASIEAARAGEAGRGFAVVAKSISDLSADTQKQVIEITNIITTLINDFNECVVTLNEAVNDSTEQNKVLKNVLEEFEKLSSEIESTSSRVNIIVKSSENAIIDINSITHEVEELSSIAENSAASTEEVNASIEEINALMHGLASTVDNINEESKTLDTKVNIFKK